ncbi:MAG: N-acetyltransferase family protein [Actinomycetota bacterium]
MRTDPTPLARDAVVVRPARGRDARALRDLLREVVAEGRWIRSRRALRTVGDERRRTRRSWTDDRAYLVAEVGRAVVGSLEIVRDRSEATRHVATFGMHVARAHRGRGVGTALLREALRWAEAVGVRKVELSVYPDNAAALALYASFGFREEGRLARHSLRGDGFADELLMGRWLGEDG